MYVKKREKGIGERRRGRGGGGGKWREGEGGEGELQTARGTDGWRTSGYCTYYNLLL